MKKMFLLGILLFAFLMAPWSNLSAQAPKVINYQAQIVDATTNTPLNGAYTITFSLFTEQTGGAPVWTDIKDVMVENGYMNVYLGDKNPFGSLPFDRPYYLEITVGNGNPYPRTLLSSTPYSMFAVDADTAKVAQDVVDGVITFAKLHPSLQVAGGDLEGFYPNPTIKSSVLNNLIKPGSITQSMLGPNVTAIPMGPAGGALIGNYPNPWLGDRVVRNENIDLGTITLNRFNVAGATPGQVASINAFGELVWGPLPTPLNTITQGTEMGQLIFWDNINKRWAISPADAPAAGDVLTWNALTNSFEWAAPSTFNLPFAFTGATNGQTAVSITKTDGPGDGIKIELTDPTAGTALHAHNASPTAYAIHTENNGGGPTFHADGSPAAGTTPESYVAHFINNNAEGRTMLIEGTGLNSGNLILDPTDADNATLVVRNNATGTNKTAIKTYGDIYANSRIGATTIIANSNLIIGDPNGVNTTITPPAAAGDPIGINGNAHVGGNLHVAGNLMVDGTTNFMDVNLDDLFVTDSVLAANIVGTNIYGTNGTIGTFNATTATLGTANITTSNVTNSNVSGTATIGTLNATTGTISTLNATTGTIETLNSTTANLTSANISGAANFSGASVTFGGTTEFIAAQGAGQGAGANGNILVSRGAGSSPQWTNTLPALTFDNITVNNDATIGNNLTVTNQISANDVMAVNVNGDNGVFTGLTVGENLNVGGNIIASDDISAGTFTGNGANLTNLNADAITTGTIAVERLSGTYDIDISGVAQFANSLLFPFEPGAIDAGAWLMNLDNSADATVGSESGVANFVLSNAGNTSPVLRLSHANANGTALLIDGGKLVANGAINANGDLNVAGMLHANGGLDVIATTAAAGGSYLLNLQQLGTGPGMSIQSFNTGNDDIMLYVENASSGTGRAARFYNSDENNTGYALSVENAGNGQGLWVLGGSTAVSVGDVDAVAGGETDLTGMNRFTVIRVADNGGATTINEANLPNTATVVDGTLLYIVNDSGAAITSDLGNITDGGVATFVRVAGAWRRIN